ncbi:MAG: TPR end-of-group domain-containing protein [bacterium]
MLRREYIQNGKAFYSSGDYASAIEYFTKAFELDPTCSAISYNIACCYSLLNDSNSAIYWLEKTAELGMYLFTEDPDFDNIKDTNEFKKLAEKVEVLLEEARKNVWETKVFIPSDYTPEKMYSIFIMLHGFGGSPFDFIRGFQEYILERGFIYVVPYGTEIFGTTSFGWGDAKKTEEKILSEIRRLKREYSIDNSNIILGGYSQGGSRAFSVGIRNSDIFRGFISVAGFFDEEGVKDSIEKLKNRGDFRFYIITGGKNSQEIIDSNKRAKELLEDYGAVGHIELFDDVGHSFPGDPETEIGKAIDFIISK